MFFDRLPDAGYVCAHRGARSLAPENTMLAAELAVECGADFWEMDVHKVADGSLVVFHDEDLKRTTDAPDNPAFVGREPWATHDFTLKELRRLDAGSWFLSADPYGTVAGGGVTPELRRRIPGQTIPSLREALEFTLRHDLPMNLEIKDQQRSPGDLSIVSDVLGLMRETGTEDLILISSFNHEYLAEMHRLAPEIPLGVLVEDEQPEHIVEYVLGLGASGYHPDHELIDADLVRRLTERGIRVSPWTVNDMDRAVELVDAGCFGVITDFPQTLRDTLAGRR